MKPSVGSLSKLECAKKKPLQTEVDPVDLVFKDKPFNTLPIGTLLAMDKHGTNLDVVHEGFVRLLLCWLAVSLQCAEDMMGVTADAHADSVSRYVPQLPDFLNKDEDLLKPES